jgi:hypothetical protein
VQKEGKLRRIAFYAYVLPATWINDRDTN